MSQPEPLESASRRVLPESTFGRSAKLLSLPLGAAARAGVGVGRKLLGASAEDVDAALRDAAAEQLFQVLGELKGGAMKFGQAMSLFEAMLPEEWLRRSANGCENCGLGPAAVIAAQAVLRPNSVRTGADDSPPSTFDRRPRRPSAVHRATFLTVDRWPSRSSTRALTPRWPATSARSSGWPGRCRRSRVGGRRGAHPGGRGPSGGGGRLHPEGAAQQQVAEALVGHPRFVVPQVHLATESARLDWVDGAKLTSIIDRPQEERNRPHSTTSRSCSPACPSPASCTATRILATTWSPRTPSWASSISDWSPGSPTDCHRPWAG